MPARTCVFVGDNMWLNALAYRQMSGRAGRRGYDLIGHTVFMGVPEHKVHRLITAEVPFLRGNFGLNPTFIARQLMLREQCDDTVTRRSLVPMLIEPFFGFNDDWRKSQIVEFFYFSVQHLVRAGWLDARGCARPLAGALAHLHDQEPANFAFFSLLASGALHQLCNISKTRSAADNETELLSVLAHLFARLPVHSALLMPVNLARSKSPIALPPLNDKVASVLDATDALALDSFVRYAVSTARQLPARKDDALPASGDKYQVTDDGNAASAGAAVDGALAGVASTLSKRAVPFVVSSS